MQKELSDSLQDIQEYGQSVYWKSGERVDLHHKSGPHFYFIASGRLRGYILDNNGRDLTIEIIPAGRLIGEASLLQSANRYIQLEAVTDSIGIRMDISQLSALMEKTPQVIWPILQMLSESIDSLSRQIERLTLMSADEKVADYLCEQTREDNPDLNIQKNILPYTHDEIARCLNLQRPTVTKILRGFEEKGWITLGYRMVEIRCRPKLEAWARKSFES